MVQIHVKLTGEVEVPSISPSSPFSQGPYLNEIIDPFKAAQQIRRLGGFACGARLGARPGARYQIPPPPPPKPAPDAGPSDPKAPDAGTPLTPGAGSGTTGTAPSANSEGGATPPPPPVVPGESPKDGTPPPPPASEPAKPAANSRATQPLPDPKSNPAPPTYAPVGPDTDGDGVPNDKDLCPKTPTDHAGVRITATGCLNAWDDPGAKQAVIGRSGPGFKKRGTLKAGGTFNGTYQARFIIPDLEKAIKLFTGENTAAFRQLPNIVSAEYTAGILTYFLRGDITKISIPFKDEPLRVELGALGYKIKTGVDRSQIAQGIVTISWNNVGPQPTTRPTDNKSVSNFSRNNGYWKLTKIDGYDPPLYQVEWHAETDTNDDSLPNGTRFVLEGTVRDASWRDTRATVKKAGHIVRDLR